MTTINISEQDNNGQKIYHWQIIDQDGHEFSHSAYHTDRTACEREAKERLEQYTKDGVI